MSTASVYWILTQDQIRSRLQEYMDTPGDKVAFVEISWFEGEREYFLELHPRPIRSYFPKPGDGFPGLTSIASISKYTDGNPDIVNLLLLRKEGQKLYFRFRDQFPITRNLGCS